MVLPFLAAAAPFLPWISAGLGAVGSIFGAFGASQPKTVRSEVDFGKMVADAEAAGFNPLTVLRNGGMAGYAMTHSPGLNAAEAFGQGLTGVGASLGQLSSDILAQQRAATEWKVAEAQIANLQADTRMRSQSFNVPTYQGSARDSVKGPWEVAKPEPVVAIRTGGATWLPDTGWSNTQEFEDRYGDPMSWIYGVGAFGADVLNTVKKIEVPQDTGFWPKQNKDRPAKDVFPNGGAFWTPLPR